MDLISPAEDAIIKRLEVKTAKRVLVQGYPDDPEIYEPTHAIGALLVRYIEGNYGNTRDTSLVIQDREMLFEVTLAMWSLRGKQGGIYEFMETARTGLTGFVPPNCSNPLTPISEGYVGRSAGLKIKNRRLWQYQITFKTETLNIEIQEEEPVILVKRITAISESTNETIVVSSEVP